MRTRIRGMWLWSLLLIIGVGGGAWWCYRKVAGAGRGRLYRRAQEVPKRPVGIVLGTSHLLRSGRPNRFFTRRIDAATALYRAGKVDRLLLSGDHHGDYNEPARMKDALLARGIPESALLLDGAGYRTLDSMLRAKTEYGLHHLTVISQRFHLERALLIARHHGIDAIGFCAGDVHWPPPWRTRIREVGARLRALVDLYGFKKVT